jgi:hypothetical protein
VLGSALAAVVLAVFHSHLAAALPLGIVTYFAVLLAYERVAFPDDFSVVQVLITQLRARFGRAPATGEIS